MRITFLKEKVIIKKMASEKVIYNQDIEEFSLKVEASGYPPIKDVQVWVKQKKAKDNISHVCDSYLIDFLQRSPFNVNFISDIKDIKKVIRNREKITYIFLLSELIFTIWYLFKIMV